MRGLLNCSEMCMNQSDCDGFSHRIFDDVCGLWRKAPFKLHYDKNFDCYLKHRSRGIYIETKNDKYNILYPLLQFKEVDLTERQEMVKLMEGKII